MVWTNMAFGKGGISAILTLGLVISAASVSALDICVKSEGSSTCDVIAQNEAMTGYVIPDDGSPDSLTSFDKTVDSATFTVSVSSGDLKSPEIVAIAEDSTIDPSVTYDFSEKGLGDGESGTFTVAFNCASEGQTVVVLAIKDGSSQGTGSLAKFSVTKSCGGIAASQDSERVKGVEVATAAAMEKETRPNGEIVKRLSGSGDVVSNGKTKPLYVVGGGNGLASVGPKKKFSEFYLQASKNSDIDFAEPVVFAESSVCRPELSGSASGGGVLKKPKSLAADAPKTLVVTFNCRKSGWTPVTVRIPFLPEGSVTFTVNKTCSVENPEGGSSRPVRTQASVPGLKLKLNDGDGTLIVSDGLTVPEFTEGMVKATRKAVVVPSVSEVGIIAVMDKDGDGAESQAVSDPVLFVSDSSVLEAEIDGKLDVVTQEESSFKIKFNCLKTGEAVVITTIALNPATVSPVQFALYKLCKPTDIEASAAKDEVDKIEKEEQSVHLSIYTDADGDPDVINNGQVQKDFDIAEIQKEALPVAEELKPEILKLDISSDCKDCMAPSESANRALAGSCLRNDKCTKDESIKIAKAFAHKYQKKLEEIDSRAVADAGVFSADFYLKSSVGNVQIGSPEVVSMNETVCAPVILGEASDARAVGQDVPVKMSVAFDCAAIGGVTLVQVKIPILSAGRGVSIQFGIIKHCTEVNATAYGGTPDENAEMSSEMGEVMAMSGVGINVGTKKEGDDAANVIDNGLVLPQWITAKTADDNDSGGYRATPDESTISFWISAVESQETPPMIGVPQVITFNPRVCKVQVTEESPASRKSSKKGKHLLSSPLQLDITFECLQAGIAVIAVAIPLNAKSGSLRYEFAKECVGEFEKKEKFIGKEIPGVMVGTDKDLQDVVRAGRTARKYSRAKKSSSSDDRAYVPSMTAQSTFFMYAVNEEDGSARNVEYGTPIVVSHRPICHPKLSGDGAKAGALTAAPLEISVDFSCVWEGQTSVTVIIPIKNSDSPNNLFVSWTILKQCGFKGNDVAHGFEVNVDGMELTDKNNDGIMGPDEEYLYEFEDEEFTYWSYDDEDYLFDDDLKPDEWGQRFDDYYGWYNYAEEEALFDDQFAWHLDYYADYDYYGNFAMEEDELFNIISQEGSSFDNTNLEIGTSPGGNDVVKDGLPQPRFKMCEAVIGTACPIQALYSTPDVYFYVSAKDLETLGIPTVTAKFPNSVKASIVGAVDLKDKVVDPEESVEVRVHMECLRDGVTSPVLVDIPYGYGVHHASFSIVKVCSKQVSSAAVAFETTSVLIGMGVLVSLVLSFLAGRKLKKTQDGRDLSA